MLAPYVAWELRTSITLSSIVKLPPLFGVTGLINHDLPCLKRSYLDAALHLIHSNASQVWHLAICTLEDFRKATSLDLLPPGQSSTRWETPSQGVFKSTLTGQPQIREGIPALE